MISCEISHDDVIKWNHFSALLTLCARNSPVTGEFPSQRPVMRSLMFSLIRAWTNGRVNNRDAGDLRHHRAHYDVIVMFYFPEWHFISKTVFKIINNFQNLEGHTQLIPVSVRFQYVLKHFDTCAARFAEILPAIFDDAIWLELRVIRNQRQPREIKRNMYNFLCACWWPSTVNLAL